MESAEYLLLAAKTSTLRTQRDFIEAARMAWLARGEDKPGKSCKPKAFTLLREFYKQSAPRPPKYQARKHLCKETGLSKAHATRLVTFYLLWECRSYVTLSQKNKDWIAKHFPQYWNPFRLNEKIVKEGFALLRAAEREIAQVRAAPTPAPTQAPTAPNPSRRTRLVTREFLIKNGFL